MLKETPHIKLRKANRLINIDYTACDILGLDKDSRTAAARSYKTIIGVYTIDNNNNKIYFETSETYSTTTAKHKNKAAEIARYNGYKIITDVNPQTVYNLYYDPSQAPAITEIVQETKQKQELQKQLKNNKLSCFIKTQLLRENLILPQGPQKTRNYKNGRRDVVYLYKTNFKTVQNIRWEEVQINRPETVITDRGVFRTNQITRKIQKIRKC